MSTPNQPLSPDTAGIGDDQAREAVEVYVEQLRVFRVHAAVFAASMVVIFAVNLVTNLAAGIGGQWWAWWSIWALIGWSLGLVIHGLVVRLARPKLSGSTWAERKVDSILSEADDSQPS